MRAPLDPFSEVVDERRRWTPEWYSWLEEIYERLRGAAFVATKGGVDQAVNTASPVKLTFTTEFSDNRSTYDPVLSRWTPPQGPVLITGNALITRNSGAWTFLAISVYKNGVFMKSAGAPTAQAAAAVSISFIDVAGNNPATGEPDFYELYVQSDSADYTVSGGVGNTGFQGITV